MVVGVGPGVRSLEVGEARRQFPVRGPDGFVESRQLDPFHERAVRDAPDLETMKARQLVVEKPPRLVQHDGAHRFARIDRHDDLARRGVVDVDRISDHVAGIEAFAVRRDLGRVVADGRGPPLLDAPVLGVQHDQPLPRVQRDVDPLAVGRAREVVGRAVERHGPELFEGAAVEGHDLAALVVLVAEGAAHVVLGAHVEHAAVGRAHHVVRVLADRYVLHDPGGSPRRSPARPANAGFRRAASCRLAPQRRPCKRKSWARQAK